MILLILKKCTYIGVYKETEKQTRLEILSQNRKDLHPQAAKIKQTIKNVLDNDPSLVERIRTLFREQVITIISIINALSLTTATIALAITGDLE